MTSRIRLLTWVLVCVAAAGCSKRDEPPAAAQPAPAATAAAPDARPKIVALGDSLTAGYGLADGEAYPALLQRKLDETGYQYEVVNAGVSGDTTAGGVRRLDWALDGNVKVLVLALGANDGLRGLPVAEMKRNLGTIIDRAQAKRVTVLLAGMEAPPNLGPEYAAAFRGVYRDLAREKGVVLLPFLLEGVAGRSELNLGDAIHPNQKGAAVVSETVWAALKPVLDQLAND